MARLLGMGFVPLVLLALWVYCIFDVIASEDTLIRNLPKGMWLVIVIFLPDIGSLAWLALGRPLHAGWRPGDTASRRPPRRSLGPEDRDDFPVREDKEDRLRAWEENLRRREEELRRRDDEDGGPPA